MGWPRRSTRIVINNPASHLHGVYVPHAPAPKRGFRKRYVVIILLLALFVGWFFLPKSTDNPRQTVTSETPPSQTTETTSKTVRVIATGDIIPHDALNAAAKNGDTYDYYQFMKNMQPYFDASDVRFCNQAVLGGGVQFGIKGYPVFNSPLELARDMNKLGCNVVNTGSNHTNDLGQAEIDATVASWDDKPNMLAVAGANRSDAEKQKVRLFEKSGVTFAFLSYTSYTNEPGKTSYGLTMFSESFAKKQLAEARAKADIIIVSMRWGTEYSHDINSQQTAQSKFLANNGADIVLGHGPHALQPFKKITGENGHISYTWFSLGNFLNAQLEADSLVSSIAMMDIDVQSKKIATLGYLPIYMHYEWTAQQKAREDLMARKNFAMHLLEESAEPLTCSQLGTSVDVQQTRVKKLLGPETNMLTKSEFLRR